MRSKRQAPPKDHKVRRRAHTARLDPTPEQAATLDRQGHTARALWNLLHEWYTWGGAGGSIAKRPSWKEMDRQLREARTNPLPATNGSPCSQLRPPSRSSSTTCAPGT